MRAKEWLSGLRGGRDRPVSRRIATVADGLAGGRDNFLLLRLLAASLVIYGHAPAITGGRGWPDVFVWLGWGSYSGDLAVDVFFVVSGFMIAGSYLRRQHLADFLWARLLRIYPAYIVCLLGTAFVLGAACTSLPLHDYYGSHEVVRYVSKNVQLGKGLSWELPGVFTGNPKLAFVNGSIWTLPAEVRMYLWVALAGVLGILSRRWCCTCCWRPCSSADCWRRRTCRWCRWPRSCGWPAASRWACSAASTASASRQAGGARLHWLRWPGCCARRRSIRSPSRWR
ncbi:acyltransferase family protein [Rhodanobacter geophilus]|uniref:Acyltransferase family protein n=1 Tax=Rhodanobacter geophilus TaxID=3162488 RepID=A0ABV3QRP9_9GAMM